MKRHGTQQNARERRITHFLRSVVKLYFTEVPEVRERKDKAEITQIERKLNAVCAFQNADAAFWNADIAFCCAFSIAPMCRKSVNVDRTQRECRDNAE